VKLVDLKEIEAADWSLTPGPYVGVAPTEEDEDFDFEQTLRDIHSKADRERLKQASKSLLASLKALLQPMPDWTQKEATQAEVKVFILDDLYRSLPRPPFTEVETEEIAEQVYDYVWQRSSGQGAQSFV
jgi:type I restriction enzyme R subunit